MISIEEAIEILKAGWVPTTLSTSARPSFTFEEIKAIIELLEKAIVPKYKIGQEVWGLMRESDFGTVAYKDIVKEIIPTYCLIDDSDFGSYLDEELFTTEAEALASLQKGDNE